MTRGPGEAQDSPEFDENQIEAFIKKNPNLHETLRGILEPKLAKDLADRDHKRWKISVSIALGALALFGILLVPLIDGRVATVLMKPDSKEDIDERSRSTFYDELESDKALAIVQRIAEDNIALAEERIGKETELQSTLYELFLFASAASYTAQFHPTEVQKIMALLEKVKDYPQLADALFFPRLLQAFVAHFVSRNQINEVHNIIRLFENKVLTSKPMANQLIDLYGRHLVYNAKYGGGNFGMEVEEVFQRVEILLQQNGTHGRVKIWRIAYELSREEDSTKQTEIVNTHIHDLHLADIREKVRAILVVFLHQKSERYQVAADRTAGVVTTVFERLYTHHSGILSTLIIGDEGKIIKERIDAHLDGHWNKNIQEEFTSFVDKLQKADQFPEDAIGG